jgi:ABC-type sugar transport system permease subunit
VLTYQFSFKSFSFGKGAANAMILLIILAVFLVAYVAIVMRNVEE